MDPNSLNLTYGEVTWTERAGITLARLYALVVATPKVLIRRLSSMTLSIPPPSSLPDSLRMDLQLETIKIVHLFLSARQMRYTTLSGPRAAERTLNSIRYSSYKSEIFVPIHQQGFHGYWISLPTRPSDENEHTVIYYLHGGGYVQLLPHHYITFLMRLLEALKHKHNLNVSIFALDYTLSPEVTFPTQLQETVRGWEYLTTERGIPAENIIAMGDSTGGNLLLSFLTHLCDPHPEIGGNTRNEKPGCAVLLAPRATFRTSAPSFTTNRYHDLLGIHELEYFVPHFRGKLSHDDPLFLKYTEFVHPVAGYKRDWRDILPKRTWVGVGDQELFLSDVVAFAEQAKTDGAQVKCWIGKRMWHDPWVFETLMPGAGDVEAFLKTPIQDEVGDEILPITVGLAADIAVMVSEMSC